MRLLTLDGRDKLSLTENLLENIPPYAVLSHTWGADHDEVTLEDLGNGLGKDKAGYEKILFCGTQARKDGIEHFWVDTCCINKANHSELSEAIVSMFNWYQNAVKCYVYLSDVTAGKINDNNTQQYWESDFRTSRWFRRGWTLQELLAPVSVEFFSRERELLGSKKTLKGLIHEITEIPSTALEGAPLSHYSVDERLQWAAGRHTKRAEDKAYSLLGIFKIYMPLIYGEGENAFRRLKEEINRSSETPFERPENTPSPSCGVPFRRDDDFVDRGDLLRRIEVKCTQGAGRVALVGIGGVGKSQLVIEYCHRLHERSPNTWIFWVHASNAERIEQDYHKIAEQAKIPGRQDPQQNIFELVARWLRDEKNGKWLLVLDNADDDTVLSTPQMSASKAVLGEPNIPLKRPLSAYLPQSVNGSLLVTTRTRSVAIKLVEPRDAIALEPMAPADAVALLRKKLDTSSTDKDVEELASILEYMPLAIVQAAAYIQQKGSRYKVRQYLEEFQRSEKRKTILLNYEAGYLRRDPEAKNSIIITWQISFNDIRERWPSAADLLSLMSFFDRQGIPKEALVVQALEGRTQDSGGQNKKDGESGESHHDEDIGADKMLETSSDETNDEFEENIDRLRSYSFVAKGVNEETFEMHGLVQIATRKWLEIHGEAERWRGEFCRKLSMVIPTGEYKNWSRCAMLFPHAVAAERQRPAEAVGVREWAQVMRKAGWYALEKGEYVGAERLCEKSVQALRKALGGGDIETSYSLGLLASTYINQGRWKEAVEILVQVTETHQRVLGVEHPDTLTSMGNLALTYWNQGRWKEAEEIQVQVIETRKRVHGVEHPDLLTSMGNLALTYMNQGRWKEAEKIQMQVVETRQRVLGVEHPDMLKSMANLALTYWRQGRWKEAEEIQLQVMETRKRVLRAEHPETLRIMGNLASTYTSQGRWKEAEEIRVQVTEAYQRVLGVEHPETLTSVGNLALMYWYQGRWKEAEEIEVHVMETRKRVLRVEHPDTLMSIHNLAFTLKDQGRDAKAIKLMEECAHLRHHVLGAEHPDTLSSVAALNAWQNGELSKSF